jgi:hypothetical protein
MILPVSTQITTNYREQWIWSYRRMLRRRLHTAISAYTFLSGISPRHKNGVMVVRFEVFTAVTMKNGVFLDVTPCGSCKNRHFGGT